MKVYIVYLCHDETDQGTYSVDRVFMHKENALAYAATLSKPLCIPQFTDIIEMEISDWFQISGLVTTFSLGDVTTVAP